jgi:hypothetical protein
MIRRLGALALLSMFAMAPALVEAAGARGGMVVSPFGPLYDTNSPEYRAAGGNLEVYQMLMEQKAMMQYQQQMMKMQQQYQQMMKNQQNNPQMNSSNMYKNAYPTPPAVTSKKKKRKTTTTSTSTTSTSSASKTAKPAAKGKTDKAKTESKD